MSQLDLFIQPHTTYRRNDPDTSKEAGESVSRETHFKAILEALDVPRGKDGIARRTGLDGVQVARRVSELIRLGKVLPTGRKVRSDKGFNEREYERALGF